MPELPAAAMTLVEIAKTLEENLAALSFSEPVTHVYHPLDYAWAPHQSYLARYGHGQKEVVLFGMNPGPWGMVQTGVPFGDVVMVRDWLGIEGRVGQPKHPHPKRPVEGFSCTRREMSGKRVWGWARDRFGTPEKFFERFFIANYCPLAFFENDGKNRTPDKLRPAERELLLAVCDTALREAIGMLQPRWVLPLGRFAERCAKRALDNLDVRICMVPHPSPANPQTNRGWDNLMDETLADLGIAAGEH